MQMLPDFNMYHYNYNRQHHHQQGAPFTRHAQQPRPATAAAPQALPRAGGAALDFQQPQAQQHVNAANGGQEERRDPLLAGGAGVNPTVEMPVPNNHEVLWVNDVE